MTGVVLALAGLTCGDGGMGGKAATAPLTEPLRPDLSRDWEGTEQWWMDDDIDPVRLSRGQMTTVYKGRRSTVPFTLTLSPGGLARGSWGEVRFHGTYRMEADRLLICILPVGGERPTACTRHDGILLTLKPAARRPR